MTETLEGKVNVMYGICGAYFDQGLEQGMEQGIEQGIRIFIIDKIEDQVAKPDVIKKLVLRFNISEEDAITYYDKFSKINA